MIAKIKVWGKEYVLDSISFKDEKGEIHHICFIDKNNELRVVFNLNSYDMENTDVTKGSLRMDLSQAITWEEIKHESSAS